MQLIQAALRHPIETQAHVSAVEADLAEAEAKVAKAKADEEVASVHVKVAETEVGRLAALISYAQIRSPFAGIISQRNIDTGYFVQPGTGSQPPLTSNDAFAPECMPKRK